MTTDGAGGGTAGRPRGLRGVLADALPRILMVFGIVLLVATALYARGAITTSSATPEAAATAASHGMARSNGHVVNVNLTTVETDQTIVPAASGVPAVVYHVWTFDGTAPGPVVRVHLGDTVHFTLHNASTMGMQHSIDFHAAMTAWANLPSGTGNAATRRAMPGRSTRSAADGVPAAFGGAGVSGCRPLGAGSNGGRVPACSAMR